MTSKPIACDLHDYLEIAGMYRYRVKLTLKDGQTLEGTVIDITTIDKREFLILDADERRQVELTGLTKMKVLTQNAKFSEVNF